MGPILGWTLAAVALAAVVVAGALYLSQSKDTGTGAPNTPTVLTPTDIAANGLTLGDPSAPVTMDLYADFRCSACHTFTEGGTEERLVTKYIATGKVKLVWHDRLVIDGIKGETASRDAANAAWCAADQGKFWTMHDWLYANQSSSEAASAFSAARLSEIGMAAGLDMARFQPCLDQGTHNNEIANEDRATSQLASGTPTVYVNGKLAGRVGYIPSYDQISALVDAALAAPAPTPTPTSAPTPTAPAPSAS